MKTNFVFYEVFFAQLLHSVIFLSIFYDSTNKSNYTKCVLLKIALLNFNIKYLKQFIFLEDFKNCVSIFVFLD